MKNRTSQVAAARETKGTLDIKERINLPAAHSLRQFPLFFSPYLISSFDFVLYLPHTLETRCTCPRRRGENESEPAIVHLPSHRIRKNCTPRNRSARRKVYYILYPKHRKTAFFHPFAGDGVLTGSRRFSCTLSFSLLYGFLLLECEPGIFFRAGLFRSEELL